jgi:hypothetical protein
MLYVVHGGLAQIMSGTQGMSDGCTISKSFAKSTPSKDIRSMLKTSMPNSCAALPIDLDPANSSRTFMWLK